MAINTQLPFAAQAQPLQMPDPNAGMNQLARVMQIKGLQQDQQIGQMKMDEYRRSVEEGNALRSALSAPGADPYNALIRAGRVKEATDFARGKADVEKTGADTEKTKFDVANKRVDAWGQAMGFVRQNPTPDNVAAAIRHLITLGILPQEKAAEAVQELGQNPTPEAIKQFAEMGFRAALSAKDQLATIQTRNTGATTDTLAIDPVTQQVRVANSVQNTQSPDAVLSAQISEANNRRSVGAQYDLNRATREAAQTTAQATREAATIKDRRDTEMKLGDDYRNQSKPFKEVSDAYKIITASLDKATTSPAATLAGATKFMKLLDPGSVVRESELGMALAATGVLDRAANYYNTLKLGKVLTEKQAADFRNIAGQIYKAAQDGQKQVDANYTRQAETYNLRPNMIVQDLGQNQSVPVDLGSLPTSGGGGGKPRELQWGK